MAIIDAIRRLYRPIESGGRFTLPENFPAFDGHFPGQPVLPAVVQIMTAVYVISAGTGKTHALKEIRKAKFTAVISAGDTIDVLITPRGEVFDVIIKNADTVFSSFQIVAG
jgi:3-hydroxyacyl-[acyl-carrier-protein] dehydratase